MRAFLIALARGLAALAWLAGMLAKPVNAQEPQCAPVNDALAALDLRYQEQPRVSGLTAAGTLLIITGNAAGGFSVLLVSPDGQACMVAHGASLEVEEAPKPGVDG